jgi:hypothetical protein
VFVDMNRNGVRDQRESPTAAWRRLGLLRADEELTREKYASCLQTAAEQLGRDGFFSDKTVQWYIEQAKKADIRPTTVTQ